MNLNTFRISKDSTQSLQDTDADLWNIYMLKSLINPFNIAYTFTINTFNIAYTFTINPCTITYTFTINPCNITYTFTINPSFLLDRSKET